MFGIRPFGPLPFGAAPVAADAPTIVIAEAQVVITGEYSVYVSTREFITGSTDEPARQPFDGTLEQPLRFQRSINGDGFSGFIQGQGSMVIDNVDGAYDFLPQFYALDGRDQEVRFGVEGEPYRNWITIFAGTASDFHVDEDSFSVDLQDYGYKFDVPLQSNTYAGTGGVEGGTDLVGKRKPLAYGYVSNGTPVLVSASVQLYQVHDGSLHAIAAVYANGVALTFGADHPDAASLLSATVGDGYFDTCLAAGLFRIDFLLDGDVITADIEGDAADGAFVSTVSGIVRRIASRFLQTSSEPVYELLAWDNDGAGDVPIVWDDEDGNAQFLTWQDPAFRSSALYEPAFARHATQYPFEVGHYFAQDDTSSVADALSRIAGYGNFIGFRRDGKLTIGRIGAADGPPVLRIDRIDIMDVRREKLPPGLSPPPWRWKIGYGRNWRVQDSEVAGSVTADRRAFLAEELRYAMAESAAVKNDHPFAQEREVGGYFRDKDDAQTEGNRLLALFSRSASLYRLTIDERGFGVDVGDTVHVTFPRFDLGNGRSLIVVEINEDAGLGQTVLLGWG
ncbi:hypothetical protein [Shinella sp.]|uniref:hypothetical protein n=1 Tax=Shinella sp. TaxID=1870904 RepID=UPI0029A9C1D0|nr:hypothetical protein [Shinella sp.]MDX3973306.1 hypothetical protein [Shinella sp.]